MTTLYSFEMLETVYATTQSNVPEGLGPQPLRRENLKD
jgi:hypothetical protein